MASRGAAGTQLSAPKGTSTSSYSTPKLHDEVTRQGRQLTKAKDALMRTFGSGWMESSVKGKVISVAKTKWRVEWTIGEATIVLDHGKAFWKPKITPSTNGDVGSVSSPAVENDRLEEEEDRGDHEMEAAREDDNEGHEEGEDDANDPLKCKLGGEFLKWEKLDSGVIVDQRAKDGWGNKLFRVHWPRETAHQEHKTEEECWNLLFPVHWFLAENGPLGWTNASLPDNVDVFTEYQFIQCIGVLYGKCLLPSGSIRELWNKTTDGFVQAMNIGGRFGLVRDRFEQWRKYLKLWPQGSADNPYARVTYLISAFNETRKNNVAPGTGVCIDESMGKWIPFFSDTPEGIPHLTKLIRKPVGVGSEYKCMADAFSGIMLFLELQQCKESMKQKKWCDKYPKHVALSLRLTEMLHGKGHIVYGDSYFTSIQTVKALLEHGTYYLGMLSWISKEISPISCLG